MDTNESVTPQQLILLRRIQEGEQIDGTNDEKLTKNLRQLNQQDLIEIDETEQGVKAKFLTTKALRLMAESGIFFDRTVSHAEEVVKLYSINLKKQKIIDDIEKIVNREDISNEEKLKQVLGMVRFSKMEPTY